jgi:hypothetical protein
VELRARYPVLATLTRGIVRYLELSALNVKTGIRRDAKLAIA